MSSRIGKLMIGATVFAGLCEASTRPASTGTVLLIEAALTGVAFLNTIGQTTSKQVEEPIDSKAAYENFTKAMENFTKKFEDIEDQINTDPKIDDLLERKNTQTATKEFDRFLTTITGLNSIKKLELRTAFSTFHSRYQSISQIAERFGEGVEEVGLHIQNTCAKTDLACFLQYEDRIGPLAAKHVGIEYDPTWLNAGIYNEPKEMNWGRSEFNEPQEMNWHHSEL